MYGIQTISYHPKCHASRRFSLRDSDEEMEKIGQHHLGWVASFCNVENVSSFASLAGVADRSRGLQRFVYPQGVYLWYV
jgi:hypothetical protein